MDKIRELTSLFLPEGILEYFEYEGYRIQKKTDGSYDEMTIILVEKNIAPKLPSEYRDRKISQKGFKEITINDFPIRGKRVKLLLRRRAWQIQGVNELYKKEIPELIFPGTRIEKQFADFLKE
jgi:hypothetical protein